MDDRGDEEGGGRRGVEGAGAGAVADELAAVEPVSEDRTLLRSVRDLAGLPVEDAGGLPIGRLYGALAEAETGLLRYMDLSLDALDRHVLVPIGHARVHRQDGGTRVRLRAALLEELQQVPPFPAEAAGLADPFERALLEAYGRTFHGERYYAHPAFDHRGLYAGEHPVVPDTEDAAVSAEPVPLSQATGWRVAAGEPDIRGWPLRTDDGALFTIADLIVDRAARKVRYVAVGTEGDVVRPIPVGYVDIDVDAGFVSAPGLTAEDVAALPAYAGGSLTREQEDRIGASLQRSLGRDRRYALADYRPDAFG